MEEKVLVVDDEREIRDLLKEFLTDEAYEVILASNGKEAIELAEREHPDAILLDVKMPEIRSACVGGLISKPGVVSWLVLLFLGDCC